MKATMLSIILVLSIGTTKGICALDSAPEALKQVDSAIKPDPLKQAESTCNILSEPASDRGTLEHAKTLMQHGVDLIELGQSEHGWEQATQALEIIDCYVKRKNGQLTEAELDLRTATLRIQERVMNGPCTYMGHLQLCIRRGWFPPRNGQSNRVQVQFRLHKNGNISELHITTPAACPSSNQAALSAVSNAAPFYPLPQGAPPSVLIEFTFDYNLLSKMQPGSAQRITPVMAPACN